MFRLLLRSFVSRDFRRPLTASYATGPKKNVSPPPPSPNPDDRVLMGHVKRKIVEILEEEGPMSRRKMYDEHLSRLFPLTPFTPNPPPRPIWMRAQYTPEEEKIFLTMSKFKRSLIRGLVAERKVEVMTVAKLQKLLALISESEDREQILKQKSKIERLVASESEKTFVWVLEDWVTSLKQLYVAKALENAQVTGRPVASRFKRA